MNLIYKFALIYVCLHLAKLMFEFGLKSEEKIRKNWFLQNKQTLSYKVLIIKKNFLFPFLYNSVIRKGINKELKKDIKEPINNHLLEYLSTRYGTNINKSNKVINFIYEYKFAKYYQFRYKEIEEKEWKSRKLFYRDLLRIRKQILANNVNSIVRLIQINLEKGYYNEEERQLWKEFIYENGTRIDSEKLINDFIEQEGKFETDPYIEQLDSNINKKEYEKVYKNDNGFIPKPDKSEENFKKEFNLNKENQFNRKINSAKRKIDRNKNISFKKTGIRKRKYIQHELF